MHATEWFTTEAQRSLQRLLPRLKPHLRSAADRHVFLQRLDTLFPTIFRLLHGLYGERYDFFYHLEQMLLAAIELYAERPADLRGLDAEREAAPHWYESQQVVGAVCYVDLFAGDLAGVRAKIPYFKELGINYLHLMPLFRAPEKNNDGGYAVSDYRQVNPRLGTMDDLRALAAELRAEGISLVLDFIFNHTSDEHEWAQRALAGETEYQEYYYLFPDRTLPDQYERSLREIFPEQAPGSFTYRPEIQQWVWTTFYNFQWDLNYSNPAVFIAMLREMLFLANQGVEVLRLDAVVFVWKRLGTTCENLPEVHLIIQAFNALVRLVAPAMLFKSEAIVHPDDVVTFISPQECQISYNPTMMALIWEALATRDVRLLRHSMSKRFDLPAHTAWVNYVRVHDDIGWSFANEDAAELGINGFDHRQFLNQFYTGKFPGSFAVGLPFNFNPVTLDMRICGTAASLAGLEQAQALNNATYREHALKRLLMIHSIILSAGGIPLLYLGDEIATCNDYHFQHDPDKAGDNRWVHRPPFDWQRAEQRHSADTDAAVVFQGLARMIAARRQNALLGAGPTVFFDPGSEHVLAFVRSRELLVLCNFSDTPQTLQRYRIAPYWTPRDGVVDLLSGQLVTLDRTFVLSPYETVWLAPQESPQHAG